MNWNTSLVSILSPAANETYQTLLINTKKIKWYSHICISSSFFVKHFWLHKCCILNSVQIYVGHYKMFRKLTIRSVLSFSLVKKREKERFLKSIKHSFLSLEGVIFRLELIRNIVWKGQEPCVHGLYIPAQEIFLSFLNLLGTTAFTVKVS